MTHTRVRETLSVHSWINHRHWNPKPWTLTASPWKVCWRWEEWGNGPKRKSGFVLYWVVVWLCAWLCVCVAERCHHQFLVPGILLCPCVQCVECRRRRTSTCDTAHLGHMRRCTPRFVTGLFCKSFFGHGSSCNRVWTSGLWDETCIRDTAREGLRSWDGFASSRAEVPCSNQVSVIATLHVCTVHEYVDLCQSARESATVHAVSGLIYIYVWFLFMFMFLFFNRICFSYGTGETLRSGASACGMPTIVMFVDNSSARVKIHSSRLNVLKCFKNHEFCDKRCGSSGPIYGE